MTEITQILQRLSSGDRAAVDDLAPLVYQKLRQIAQNQLATENDARSWDATELVHEAYIRLIGDTPINWKDRAHFFATAATAIRRVLVDNARKRRTQKRGGNAQRIGISPDGIGGEDPGFTLIDLNDALDRLGELNERQARLVELRFFWRFDTGRGGRVARHISSYRSWRLGHGKSVAVSGTQLVRIRDAYKQVGTDDEKQIHDSFLCTDRGRDSSGG